ncbi:MAG: aspartoacylase [Synechococcus sp.]
MASPRVLVVAGTHGNEINAPWLLDQWQQHPDLIDACGLELVPVIGNPAARAQGRRYLDRDLNRSFRPDWLAATTASLDREGVRAQALVHDYGPEGPERCAVALDLHSTTAAMGSSLVVYGRRPADLALAAAVQQRLGLPVYLHEADQAQQGFLVERWPCGLVIEIGPVPQMVLASSIVTATRLCLQACLAVLAEACQNTWVAPHSLVVHRHLGSMDLPRDHQGRPLACVHPELQGGDWRPLMAGAPLFLTADGRVIRYDGPAGRVPVFINEAAYGEKGIAFSLTEREQWPLDPAASDALTALLTTP